MLDKIVQVEKLVDRRDGEVPLDDEMFGPWMVAINQIRPRRLENSNRKSGDCERG